MRKEAHRSFLLKSAFFHKSKIKMSLLSLFTIGVISFFTLTAQAASPIETMGHIVQEMQLTSIILDLYAKLASKEAAPTNVSVSCLYGKLTASWNPVEGATYYPIRLSKAGDGNNLLVQNDEYTGTSYTLSGAPLSVGSYDFWVHSWVNGAWSDAAGVQNIKCEAPPTPTGLSATCSNGVITAKWNAISGFSNYAVRLDFNKDASGNNVNGRSGCTETNGWYCGGWPDILYDSFPNNYFSQGGFPDGTYDFWVGTYVTTLPHPLNWSPTTAVKGITCITDNGCAAKTCTTTTCNNGAKMVQGAKTCPDNSCAVNTCTNSQCWNNLAMIAGAKDCRIDNGCAANTCATATCYNSITWVLGTKDCKVDNGCAANTCTTAECYNGIAGVKGTKVCEVAVDGFCGSSNGIFSATAPTTNLCNAGKASVVAGSGPWTWTCAGIAGGFDDSCGASKATTSDNGCAINTCVGQTCNNGVTTVAGTKPCDNGCAARTCTTATCNNGISTVQGIKSCDCAANICNTTSCWGGEMWFLGTKDCTVSVDNNCAANTCTSEVCWNNETWIPGTKTCAAVCKSYSPPACKAGQTLVLPTKKDANGCSLPPSCQPNVTCATTANVVVCAAGETKVDGGTDSNGCPYPEKCEKVVTTCPQMSLPACKEDEALISNGNNVQTGCWLGSRCQKKDCTQYVPPVCNSSQVLATKGIDANGCILGYSCRAKGDCAITATYLVCAAGEKKVSGGVGLDGCPLADKCQKNPVISSCPDMSPPACNENEALISNGNDPKTGCWLGMRCQKKICPQYTPPVCSAGQVLVSNGIGADGCSLYYKCQALDNGCDARTCSSTTCNNGIEVVKGTKTCADNGCAYMTCNTASCWNDSTGWAPGRKDCANLTDNGCAANTCSNLVCYAGINNWTIGTKNCNNPTADSNCTPQTTCATSNSGMPTTCNGVAGTKQSNFADRCLSTNISCTLADCGRTIPSQKAFCTRVDSTSCNNPKDCLSACQASPYQQCPACPNPTSEVAPQ